MKYEKGGRKKNRFAGLYACVHYFFPPISFRVTIKTCACRFVMRNVKWVVIHSAKKLNQQKNFVHTGLRSAKD